MKEFISELKESKTENYDMLDEFNCLTLKILCRTAMGVDVGKENPETGSHVWSISLILHYYSVELLIRFQSVQT